MTSDDKLINQNIIKSIRSAALLSLRDFSQNKNIQLSDIPNKAPFYGFWMSIVLISGEKIRITVKCHYFSDQVRQFLPKDRMSVGAADFMKELSNLIGGQLKRLLKLNGLDTGTSLPFVVRGFDQLFNNKVNSKTCIIDEWLFTLAEASIAVTAEVEILQNIDWTNLDVEILNKSEVEFL